MPYIYVSRVGTECMIGPSHILRALPVSRWECYLNRNYADDMDEIHKAIEMFPSRVDDSGIRWIRCDYGELKQLIRKIVAARVHARLPMLFMGPTCGARCVHSPALMCAPDGCHGIVCAKYTHTLPPTRLCS